jgi:IclR family acetate operon transcriptional repressor
MGAQRPRIQGSIRAVHRVCDILDSLQESDSGMALSSLAQAVRLPKSSALRYLKTLEARQYVQRTPDGVYSAIPLSPIAPTDVNRLVASATPYMEDLRDEFHETINLGKLEHHSVRYLAIVESRRAVRLSARPSDRDLLHATALGKAIAVTLPESRVLSILAQAGMPQLTERTIASPDAFLDELTSVRNSGYALDDRENVSDGICIAVPLVVRPITAALSLSAPATRLPTTMYEQVATALRDAAQAIVAGFQDSAVLKTPK